MTDVNGAKTRTFLEMPTPADPDAFRRRAIARGRMMMEEAKAEAEARDEARRAADTQVTPIVDLLFSKLGETDHAKLQRLWARAQKSKVAVRAHLESQLLTMIKSRLES